MQVRPPEYCDVLIVGAGIAGCCLARELRERGCSVVLVDAGQQHTATRVSYGVVNPLSLARFYTSTNIANALYQHARSVYQDYGTTINLLRILENESDISRWKRAGGQFRGPIYVDELPQPFAGWAQNLPWARVHGALLVAVHAFLDNICAGLEAEGRLLSGMVHGGELVRGGPYLRWGMLQARQVVDCTGWRAGLDPRWSSIGLRIAKAQTIDLVPDFPAKRDDKFNFELVGPPTMLNAGMYISALDDMGRRFRIGPRHVPNDLSEVPDDRASADLLYRFSRLHDVPVHVVASRVGLRTMSPDGWPVIGVHPAEPEHAIFNGLGGAGLLLAPFLATMLADHLLGIRQLDPAFNVARFLQ